jgi:hypothetical protein
VNGSAKTASQARSRRRIGIQCRATIFLQEHKESSNPSQVGRARRRLAATAATLIAAAFIGLNFRSEVAAYVTRYAGQQDIFRIIKISRQVVAQETRLPSKDSGKTAVPASRQTEANQAGAPEEAHKAQQVAVAAVTEAPQVLTEERAQALAQELTEAGRAELEQLRAEAAKSVQSLEQERDKTAAVAQEAAAVRRDLTGSIVQHRRRSKRNALAVPRWRANSLRRAATSRHRSHCCARRATKPWT